MKRLLALTVFCCAACGDNLHPTPVDMVYDVSVTELSNDCGSTPPLPEERADLDLRLHLDGTVEMMGYAYGIPDEGGYPTLLVHDGIVDTENDVHADYAEKDYAYRISGTLTMDALDLTLDADWYRVESNGPVDCHRRTRIAGPARGFRDPKSLDGAYPLKTDYLGVYCDGQPVPTASLGTALYRIDAHVQGRTLDLNLEDTFWFSGPEPSSDGAVDWSGTYLLNGQLGVENVPGTLKGTFGPDEVQAALEFTDSQLDAHCRYRYEFSGKKRVASLGERSNTYRVVYQTYDKCATPPTSYAYEDVVELDDWDDASVAIYDPNGAFLIPRDGATLSASAGSEQWGEIVTFTGTASPPYLSYTYDDSLQDADGSWCSIGWNVDGVSRFFPDQPWEPAFLPDPPRSQLPSARLLQPPAPSPLALPAFGPLRRP